MSTAPTPVINPKVRTITGFVQINTESYQTAIAETLVILRKVQAEFESAGYQVETLRVTTEPFEDYAGGVPPAQGLAFLKQLNDLAAQEKCALNIGPAMLNDTDDPAPMSLLKQVLCTMPNLEASAVIADTNGIHWKTIALAAELIQYVGQNSPSGQGNFNFAALAMQPAYSPLFPGSYFNDEGQQFAVGFECANTINTVLVKDKGNFVTALPDLTAALTQQLSIANAVVIKVQNETSWGGGAYLTTASLDGPSIASAIEAYTGEKFGAGGTLTTASLIAQAMLAVDQTGISGLMLPVLGDKLLAQRWSEASFSIDSLLACSAVGARGLDSVPLPGDITVGELKRILSDVALLASKGNTPLSARLIPAPEKK